MRGKSFLFDPTTEENVVFSAETNTTEVWHKRLGHCHIQRMIGMKRKEMIRDLPILAEKLPNCNACQFGKQTRLPFLKSTWRASQKLQLIHTDLCGPQRTLSLQGSLYFILFIDDFTRMCWIFFLKCKSEVAEVFWKYKTMVENKSGYRIQVVRLDNGTEYTSSRFKSLYEEAGIEHQFTTPYTPQQNGVCERRNRYVMEMVRCL